MLLSLLAMICLEKDSALEKLGSRCPLQMHLIGVTHTNHIKQCLDFKVLEFTNHGLIVSDVSDAFSMF